jgi:hypothetical protein
MPCSPPLNLVLVLVPLTLIRPGLSVMDALSGRWHLLGLTPTLRTTHVVLVMGVVWCVE